MMNILLRANYLLHADVLQPEPTKKIKSFNKWLWDLYPAYPSDQERCYE